MTDYAEKERQFIERLEADTGRDLAGWMAAISAQKLAHRNDIIDWLRQHRFTFSKASWLERIHHNGGQPIYAEKPDLKALAAEAFDPPPRQAREPKPAAAPATAPATAPAAAVPPITPSKPPQASTNTSTHAGAQSIELEALLAKGKAFRPLAQHLLKVIEGAVPGVMVSTRAALVTLAAPREFAVLAISGKDVKLGLALGDATPRDGLEPARIPAAGTAVTHMVQLTDVRRVDQALVMHITAAARLASGA